MNIIVFDSGITQPEDKGIVLRDIIEDGIIDKGILEKNIKYIIDKKGKPDASLDRKSKCFTAGAHSGGTHSDMDLIPVQKDNCLVIGKADLNGHDICKRVYSVDHKSPTVPTGQSGNTIPKIEIKQLAHGKNKGFEKQSDKMPSITTSSYQHNNLVKVARMVGRKIDENGTRKDHSDIQPKQRLELRPDDKSGCLTGVQKDNCLVLGKVGNQNNWKEYRVKSPTLRGLSRCNNVPLTRKDNVVVLCHENKSGNRSMHTKKSCALRANASSNYQTVKSDDIAWRKLTPTECERLQTVQDNYTLILKNDKKTQLVSNSQRYKMLGNGWTVDVIAHIFKHILKSLIDNHPPVIH